MSAESLFAMTKAAVGAAFLGTPKTERPFTELRQEGEHSWRLEYVSKEHEGEPFFAERLVKHNETTGVSETLGEYDTKYAMADALTTLPDLPAPVRAQVAASAVPQRGEKSVGDLGIFRLPAMS